MQCLPCLFDCVWSVAQRPDSFSVRTTNPRVQAHASCVVYQTNRCNQGTPCVPPTTTRRGFLPVESADRRNRGVVSLPRDGVLQTATPLCFRFGLGVRPWRRCHSASCSAREGVGGTPACAAGVGAGGTGAQPSPDTFMAAALAAYVKVWRVWATSRGFSLTVHTMTAAWLERRASRSRRVSLESRKAMRGALVLMPRITFPSTNKDLMHVAQHGTHIVQHSTHAHACHTLQTMCPSGQRNRKQKAANACGGATHWLMNELSASRLPALPVRRLSSLPARSMMCNRPRRPFLSCTWLDRQKPQRQKKHRVMKWTTPHERSQVTLTPHCTK